MKNGAQKETPRWTKPVTTIGPRASLAEAWETMRQARVHHLVVTDGAQVVGILAANDLVDRGMAVAAGNPAPAPALKPLTVASVMTAIDTPPNEMTPLRGLLQAMRELKTSALPIVTGGRLAGIVTEGNLLELVDWVLATDTKEPTKRGAESGESDEEPTMDRANVLLSNPVVVNLMELLGEAGI